MARAIFLGRFEIPHGFQQSQMILLAPHKDGTSKFAKVVTLPFPGRSLGLLPVGVASSNFLANLS